MRFLRDERTASPLAQTEKATIECAISVDRSESRLACFVVFDGHASWIYRLPASGKIVIGRSETADIRLESADVSRAHAELSALGERVLLDDLGSQNGSLVNGERVVSSRLLLPGDVVTLGSCRLVLLSAENSARRPAVLTGSDFEQRLQQELDRSARYRRSFAVLCLCFAERNAAEVAMSLLPSLRLMDVVGLGSTDGEILLLLPELDRTQAFEAASRLLTVLEDTNLRLGIASHPADGTEAQTIVQRARAAARSAEPGCAKTATTTFDTFTVQSTEVIVADPLMREVYQLVRRLSTSTLPVLVHGETGTGKELISAALHEWSQRKKGPLVTVNCAALPESLIESELFGAEKGAYSGAVATKIGLIESAARGTIFFDEVGELPLGAQAKLLRVLETKKVARLGELRERDVDIRIVAATNRDLAAECEAGRFRHDLFFRLSGAMIWLPPLRERKQDLPVLVRALLARACLAAERAPMTISDAALDLLLAHRWPGNVRELKNTLEYFAATLPDSAIEREHLAHRLAANSATTVREDSKAGASYDTLLPATFRPIDEELRELECNRMLAALTAANGNQTAAADLLRMPRRTFVAKMKTHNIREKLIHPRAASSLRSDKS